MTAIAKRSSGKSDPVWGALRRCGLLLHADNRLPSVAALVAGEPIRRSWWAHPSSRDIFRAASRLAARPDVIAAKLIARKVTFVHRNLWLALWTVGTAREPWQTVALSPLAAALLERVAQEGRVRIDELSHGGELPSRPAANSHEISAAARELESRLLVFAEQFHSESGAHSKWLESWKHWARRVRLPRRGLPLEKATRQLEQAAECLAGKRDPKLLPWAKARNR